MVLLPIPKVIEQKRHILEDAKGIVENQLPGAAPQKIMDMPELVKIGGKIAHKDSGRSPRRIFPQKLRMISLDCLVQIVGRDRRYTLFGKREPAHMPHRCSYVLRSPTQGAIVKVNKNRQVFLDGSSESRRAVERLQTLHRMFSLVSCRSCSAVITASLRTVSK